MLISSSDAAAIFYFKIYVSEDPNSMRNRTIFYSCLECAVTVLTFFKCSQWYSTRPSRVVISSSIFRNGYVTIYSVCVLCTLRLHLMNITIFPRRAQFLAIRQRPLAFERAHRTISNEFPFSLCCHCLLLSISLFPVRLNPRKSATPCVNSDYYCRMIR